MKSSDFSWIKYGSCRNEPTDIFFPEEYRHNSMAEARAVCRECVARINCYQYAMSQPKIDGIWAGTSPSQRDRIRRLTKKGVEVSIDNPANGIRYVPKRRVETRRVGYETPVRIG